MPGAILHRLAVELDDRDRSLERHFELRVARHPSESGEHLLARVLAYGLELREGLEFPPGGVSAGERPALWCHDARGGLMAWIEVGTPEPRRLARACGRAERVAVYAHRDPALWLRRLAGARLPNPQRLFLHAFAPDLLAELAGRLQRRGRLVLEREQGRLRVELAGERWESRLRTLEPEPR